MTITGVLPQNEGSIVGNVTHDSRDLDSGLLDKEKKKDR